MRRGAHPPFRRCGPSCPPALMSTGDMAPPLGPPSRRLPAKHGADEEVWTSVQLDQPCTSQGAPPTKEHTTQGGYLARSGNSHPHIEQRPPCGLCPWWLLAASRAATVQCRRRATEPQHEQRVGERFRAPRPWVSALSAAATHPQTVQIGTSNAPDHPTEGLGREAGPSADTPPPHHGGQPTGHWL